MDENKKYLAVDFGGTFVKYGIVDETAAILEKGKLPAPLYGVDAFVDTLTGLYDKYRGSVQGLAVSMPGTINCETGDFINASSYSDMAGQNLYQLTADRIDVPVTVENDGKCGALAEVWNGALKEAQDGMVVMIGSAIGGGIIVNRKLHRGRHLQAGELSCMAVHSEKSGMGVFATGMIGLIVAVVTAMGMDPMEQPELEFARKYPEIVKDYYRPAQCEPPKEPVNVNGEQIFSWVDEGNPIVVPIYQEFVRDLAAGLFTVYAALDPDIIAVGGGITKQPRFIDDLNAALDELSPDVPVLPFHPGDIRVVACEYQEDENLVGAVYNYLSVKDPTAVGLD